MNAIHRKALLHPALRIDQRWVEVHVDQRMAGAIFLQPRIQRPDLPAGCNPLCQGKSEEGIIEVNSRATCLRVERVLIEQSSAGQGKVARGLLRRYIDRAEPGTDFAAGRQLRGHRPGEGGRVPPAQFSQALGSITHA